jgi:hypothetical protein
MAAPAPAPTITSFPPENRPPEKLTPSVSPKTTRTHRWRRLALILLLTFLAADYGLSGLLRFGWQNQRITRKLEAAFGRPVQVGHYSFSLMEGPRLEANSITVGEDPRFGNEYFLRADQLALGLRWSALLRGNFELGTLSFTNPRLNLVRLPDGEWNLESWLPRPPGNLPVTPVAGRGAVRFAQVQISDGRLDFKQGDDKLPFAFVNVNGSVEQAAPGSWRIDLRAQPFRAAAALQQAGELKLSGLVGGTSSRLRPAALRLDWYDASLPDVLRLIRGNDYGFRGSFAMQATARTEGPAWNYTARAQFMQLHRWDLPSRADDPDANVNVQARWMPGAHRVEMAQVQLETPHSNLHATGGFEWGFDPRTSQLRGENSRLELSSSGVQVGDLLNWYRAFHPGVADRLALNGLAGVNLTFTGWPPRIEEGSIATEGFTLSGANLPQPIRVSRASMEFSPRSISLPAVTIVDDGKAGTFRVQGMVDRRAKAHSDWKLDGQSKDVAILFGSAAEFGYQLPQGWEFAGPAQFHLEWKGVTRPALRATQGVIALDGLKIGTPFLNRAIEQIRGTVDLSPKDRRIQLASAEAFSGNWSGTLEQSAEKGGWQFALTANALDAAEMDRWLNPRRRDGFLSRVFPFLAPAQLKPVQIPAWLAGRGTLTLGEFRLAPFTLHQLHAEAAVTGRTLEFSRTQAKFYGGTLDGSIELKLNAQPAYNVKAKYRNVNLGEVAARTISLADLFRGTASGNVVLSATGLGRTALLGSLSCRGDAQIQHAEYDGLNLLESLDAGARRAGKTTVPHATATFSCGEGQIHFSPLVLKILGSRYEAAGDVSFQRRMDFEIQQNRPQSPGNPMISKSNSFPRYILTGSLKAPELLSVLRRPTPK